jgi:predicted metalloenzyme YecM
MFDLDEIIGDYETFLDEFLEIIVDEGFDLSDFSQMDHICYRTISTENYEKKKKELATLATLLTETMVNNRPICIFKLHTPLKHYGWRVDVIELPAPKSGKDFAEGLEHAEFVLYDDQATFLKKYARKSFEMKAADRGINPEISYRLPKYSVKFHLLSLSTVAYLEQKLGITEVVDGK